MAKGFTLRCHSLVSPGSLLWISFQSNCVAEVVNDHEFFKSSLDEMMIELQENSFHFANLHANMRNSGPISQISLDSSSPIFNLAKHVPHLKAGVPGPIPCVVPVGETYFEKNGQTILDFSLKYMKSKGSILLLHDGKYFSSAELKHLLTN